MNDENENIQDIPETESLDFTKADYSFTPQGVHTWRQHGYYLLCRSCELEHAIYIGAKHILVGISEDGQPILKTRIELGMA